MTRHAVVRGLAAAALLAAGPAQASCAPDTVSVHGGWGLAHFSVDVADTDAERAKGLMFVEQMGTLEGMLFLYDKPQRATFWMRNTLIPLDLLFAGPDGVITRVHENAVPMDETIIDGGDGVVAVLEINGGLAGRLGIQAGDVLQHPAFGEEAALPCE